MALKKVPTEIEDFIKKNKILTLATCDNEPWVATLYYGTDDELTLYLVTDPNSVHGKHLKQNPKVAFAIFDSHTKVTMNKKGLQGRGTCTQVSDILEIAKGLMLWHKANPGNEAKLTLEGLKKWKDTKIYKIVPNYLKFFNKELYGKEEYGIWEK